MSDERPLWEKKWPAFEAALTAKLARGHLEYGDGSFERSVPRLLDELAMEALDLAGWGFVLWCRIQDLKGAYLDGKE